MIKRWLDSSACFNILQSVTKVLKAMIEPNTNADARRRLLDAATEVFAQKGYAEASTREICKLAGANIAAIHYYFGDKASLYREIFLPVELLVQLPDEMERADIPLRDALVSLYRHMLRFVVTSPKAQYLRLLFVREQLQPAGVLTEGPNEILKPFHDKLIRFIGERFATSEPDLALKQLAFSIAGLVLVLLVERTTVDRLAPGLLGAPEAVEATVQRLADTALAVIEAERVRRGFEADDHIHLVRHAARNGGKYS